VPEQIRALPKRRGFCATRRPLQAAFGAPCKISVVLRLRRFEEEEEEEEE
jgi:hypothetical protein